MKFEFTFHFYFRALFDGDNDFMNCLKESFPQLKTRTLTRVEWCKIRRMMGKPRRCSVVSFFFFGGVKYIYYSYMKAFNNEIYVFYCSTFPFIILIVFFF